MSNENDEEEVVTDAKTQETFVIPSDKSTTEYKYEDGNPVPDRMLSIFLNEYGSYPEEVGEYVKKGDIESKTLENGNTLETVTYEHPTATYSWADFKGNQKVQMEKNPEIKERLNKLIGQKKTTTIKKNIPKNDYPVVKQLREAIAASKAKTEEFKAR